MAKERNNKEVKTHLVMVEIYDNFKKAYIEKYDVVLTYTEVSKKIAEKINSVGGVKV